jgi:hypothetical protein
VGNTREALFFVLARRKDLSQGFFEGGLDSLVLPPFEKAAATTLKRKISPSLIMSFLRPPIRQR